MLLDRWKVLGLRGTLVENSSRSCWYTSGFSRSHRIALSSGVGRTGSVTGVDRQFFLQGRPERHNYAYAVILPGHHLL